VSLAGLGFYACAVLVQSVRLRLLLVGPLRLVLAVVWLGFAALLAAYQIDSRLYLDPRQRVSFRK
jgi:hypothetical protein